jgi:MFS family permease
MMLIGLSSSIVSRIGSIGGVLPQLFVAHKVENKPHKKPVLITAITIRALCWGLLALITYLFGQSHPAGIILSLFLFLTILSFMGGVAEIAFYDIWGKAIPSTLRGRFFGYRQLAGGILAIAAGFVVRAILESKTISFPDNYALLFMLSFIFISISYLFLGSIKEPLEEVHEHSLSFREFLKKALGILKVNTDLKLFLWVQVLAGAIALTLPFYVIYAKDVLGIKLGMVGMFLSAQMLGIVLSNVLWAHLSDFIGNKRVIQLSIVLSLTVPLIALLTPADLRGLFILLFVLLGFSITGLKIGNTNFLLDIAPSKDRPTYISLKGTLKAPLFIFPLIGGGIIHFFSYRFLFVLTMLILGLAFILSCRLNEPRKKPEVLWE